MGKRKRKQNWLIYLVACFLLFGQFAGGVVPKVGATGLDTPTLAEQALQKASSAYLSSVDNTDDSNAIIRYFTGLPASTQYIQNVQAEVQSNKGNYTSLNALSKRIIGWTATGQDATNVSGMSLIQKLGSFSINTEGRWNNELIWQLIALDSKKYNLSSDAVISKDSLINSIVESRLSSGGWDLVLRHDGAWQKPLTYDKNYSPLTFGPATNMDIDTTGMALTALAPYQGDPTVSESVYQAVYQLKSATPTNSDSLSQMIIGLSAVGEDPSNFNNQNLVQQLLTYQLSNGMFKFDDSSWGSGPNSYATNDAITALTAYQRFASTHAASPIYYNMSGFYSDHIGNAVTPFLAGEVATDDSYAIMRLLIGKTANTAYIQSVQSEVYGNQGIYSSLNTLSKRVIGWSAAGQDASNVNGTNLIQKLAAFPIDIDGRWNNELIWQLIALDSKGYTLSSDAVYTRQSLISSILQSQVSSGGWDLMIRHGGNWQKPLTYDKNYNPVTFGPATSLDIDTTGMALTALAPYQSQPEVGAAINLAVNQLKSAVPGNSDSLSQMIIGLSAVGVDPSNFNNQNLVEKLYDYQNSSGMFKFDDSSWGSNDNSFATNDALTALIAYQKFAEARTASPVYYHMSGVVQLPPSNSSSSSNVWQTQIPQQTDTIILSVTGDSQHGTIYAPNSVQLQSGDTAYSVLVRALGANRIKFKSYSGSIYVQSIDGLSEFDRGPLSGWIFLVNGRQSQISASDYHLNSGDTLDWRYSGEQAQQNGSGQALSNALDSASQSFTFSYDNHQPINQVNKTVVVLNLDQKMDAQTVQQLTKLIKENPVNVSEQVTPSASATVTDTAQKVSLNIPAQAIQQPTTIGIKELSTENRTEALSPIYEFTPKGQTFVKPVDISMKVPLSIDDLNRVAMVWLNEETNQWVPIPAVVDAKTGMVTGRVNHFTKFAVIDRKKLQGSGNLDQVVQSTVQQVIKSEPLSDWSAFALARAGQPIPASYLDGVQKSLEQNNGSFRNITDYERMVLGVIAAGGDPLNVDGYNLIEKIYNNDRVTKQGTNGVIFALIALDSKDYQVQDNALWNRDKLIDWLLKSQNQDGGWALVPGDSSDLDITSMAIAALAPYQNREDVKKALDSATGWLVKSSDQAVNYSESIAQEIQGLAALGLDPTDAKYNRAGKDLISYLLQFQQADGGFAHQAGEATNPMGTEQALTALDAYQYYVNGQGSIYQFAKLAQQSNTGYADKNEISDWAYNSVMKAKEYHLMEGVSQAAPLFAPKNPVTRAQFTAVMIRLLGEKSSSTGNAAIFDDVQPTDWYYNDVKKAKELGIIHGVSDSSFGPNQPITREQMAVMIANAFHLPHQDVTVTFADQDQIAAYALPAVRTLYQQGIMVGYEGKIDPHASATREMVAALAVKLYETNKK